MENDFEKNIKTHFRNREITPNKLLWQVLESKLDKEQSTKKSTSLRYFIAASVILIFLLTLNFYKTSKPQNQITTTKKQPVITPLIQIKKEVFQTTKKQPIIVKNKKYVALKNTVKPEKYSGKNTVKLIENAPKNNQHDVSENNSDKEKITIVNKPKKILLSDAEMNALLLASLKNLNLKDSVKPTIKIKTGEILYALENEGDNTLKNKIIKKLIAGAQAVENHISNN